MEIIQDNIAAIFVAILTVGGLLWKIKNHETRISKVEIRVDDIITIKNDIKWLKEWLKDEITEKKKS